MDPRALQFGSGTDLLGGSDALNQAIARRSTGQGAPTQAVTPSSATFNPELQAPQLPNPQSTPASTVPPGSVDPMSQGAQLGMPTSNTAQENQLIIKALSSKMNSNAAIEKAQSQPQLQGGI